jgi:hypothetical protein
MRLKTLALGELINERNYWRHQDTWKLTLIDIFKKLHTLQNDSFSKYSNISPLICYPSIQTITHKIHTKNNPKDKEFYHKFITCRCEYQNPTIKER